MGRQKANIHYIYKTTCLVTGRYYIGMHSTSNLNDGYLGSGKRLRYSIRKYGKESHVKEILEFLPDFKSLVERERELITEEHLIDPQCMNLMSGGTGGWVSREVQLKCSKAGGIASGKKFKMDETYRLLTLNKLKKALEKIVELGSDYSTSRFKNKQHSDETKKLMSEKRQGMGLGESNSQYGTMWITNGIENRKLNKESSIPEGWYKGRKQLKR